jgi:hypothetical protein
MTREKEKKQPSAKDNPEKTDTTEVVDPEVHSAMKKIAETKPDKMLEFMAMEMSSIGNPLHHKMTQEHISQVLELAAKHDERQYDLHSTSQKNTFLEGKSNRAYCFAAFVLILILTGIVLFLFKNNPDVLVPILTGLGGLISGFLGGWGLGKKHQ